MTPIWMFVRRRECGDVENAQRFHISLPQPRTNTISGPRGTIP